jgi:hypothetical protein
MTDSITLKEFLQRYTAIPERFINEYIEFYDLCTSNEFGIPIENVMKYLKITDRLKLEERLRTQYKLNQDYQIIRLQQKLKKGVKDVHYMISFDGFERIAMKSTTKKGQEFRDYFIMLRKFIDYYKQHISEKIIDLTKTHKYIYILLVNKNKKIFKLGRTGDIRKRLQSYATGKDTHPDVKFIMIVNDSKKVENCAKIFLKTKQFKANKELYQENLELLKDIIYKCADMDKIMIDSINNDKKYDTYVIFDDSKSIEYLDLNGEVIGWEKGNTHIRYPKQTLKHKKDTVQIIEEINKTKKYSKLKTLKNAIISSSPI